MPKNAQPTGRKSRHGMTTKPQLVRSAQFSNADLSTNRRQLTTAHQKTPERHIATPEQGVEFSQVGEADGGPLIGVILANLANTKKRALHTLCLNARAPRRLSRILPRSTAGAADLSLLPESRRVLHFVDVVDEEWDGFRPNRSQFA
jgi:hypothetical protein